MPRRVLNVLALSALLVVVVSVHAADHREAPLISARPDADINDLYLFRSPADPDNVVMIMTVNPDAATNGFTFNPEVLYEFNIDRTGDTVPELSYTFAFSAPGAGGVQGVAGTRFVPGEAPTLFGSGFTFNNLDTPGGGKLFAGPRDDPFFFDLNGFQNNMNFTGEDFFAGQDVTALAIEVPISEITGGAAPGSEPVIGVWGRTFDISSGPNFGQVDRIGQPLINTLLIPPGRKDEFNRSEPFADVNLFRDDVVDSILGLNGNDAAAAMSLADVLLPDIMTLDLNGSAGFPNGRRLEDDVIDIELQLLTGSPLIGGVGVPVGTGTGPTNDGVDANDVPFLNVFPYLAPPNVVPEPAVMGLLLAGIGVMRRRR